MTESARELRNPARPFADGSAAGSAWADFWTRLLFWAAPRVGWLLRAARPIFVRLACWSKAASAGPAANALRIFTPPPTRREQRAFARRVVGSIYDFILDIARCARYTPDDFRRRIESVEGRDDFLEARAARRGAVVVTAHMGSFEVGLAALSDHEPAIHIVFKRDVVGHFERMRQQLRHRLGVIEVPLDDQNGPWIRLRDALREDHVVIFQGDRVLAGQKGLRVAFLGGHLLLPTGPAKLALAAGCPLIPIFALRARAGRVRVRIGQPIWPDPALAPADAVADAVRRWAAVLQEAIASHPDQWLMLRCAFCEDMPAG